LDAALRIDKSNTRTYSLLADLYRQQNDLPAAAKALRDGLDAIRQEQVKTEDKIRERALLFNIAILNHHLAQILLDIHAASQDEKVRQKTLEETKDCLQVLETTLSPNDPARFQIAGQIAMVERNWPEARTALERVLAITFDFNTVNRLVLVYSQLGMPGQGEKLLQEMLQRPGLPPAAASHFLSILAALRQEAQDYKQALTYSEQALRLDPKNERAQRVLRAVQVYQAKQEDLPDPKKIDPVARMALIQRARDSIVEEQLDQAETFLGRLIERDPKDLQALLMMLHVLVQTQQEDKAIQYVDRALKADPQNEDLKRLDALLKESDPSKRYLIEMESVDRTVSDPLEKALQKWSIAGRYGKTKESESFLEEAEKADPRSSAVIEIRFRQALAKKDWQVAEELIRRLEEKTVGEDIREIFQARLEMAREDFAAAIPLLTSFLQKAPHGWPQRLWLAECYRRTGKLDDARKEMRTCYDDNPKNLNAVVALAQLAQQRGRTDEHAMWIEEAYRIPAGRLNPYVREQHLQGKETDPENLQTAIREREQILEKIPGTLENAFRLAIGPRAGHD
jgi:tetratricopeptide (TPR) repeat protein